MREKRENKTKPNNVKKIPRFWLLSLVSMKYERNKTKISSRKEFWLIGFVSEKTGSQV
jgi:hypothetical protein